MSGDDFIAFCFVLLVVAFIWWTAKLPHHFARRPYAIRIRFSPHGARRSRWRRFWRRYVDITIQPGDVKQGTLAILDQNGNEMPDASFDAAPALTSSDTSVFTVEGDTVDFKALSVTGVGEGQGTLTAEGTSGGNTLIAGVATVTVHVSAIATSIDVRFPN